MIDYNLKYKKVRMAKENGFYSLMVMGRWDYDFYHPPTTFRNVVGPTLLVRWEDE